MSNITQAFKDHKAFIAFITGGDPDIETTEHLILSMAVAGADLIEIGIPFSDPIAEGVVIQEASARALQNGCTTDKLFEMVSRIRNRTSIPLLFMTYLNPVIGYGKEQFISRCKACRINGIIIPDLPFEEKDELADICRRNGVDLISMIAPTSAERISMIAREATGFIYCVSSLGVTGVRSRITTDIGQMIQQVRQISNIPCAIGFGISTPAQAGGMAKLADGVIIGSAIVELVAKYGKNSIEPVAEYIRSIKQGITGAGNAIR